MKTDEATGEAAVEGIKDKTRSKKGLLRLIYTNIWSQWKRLSSRYYYVVGSDSRVMDRVWKKRLF